MSPERWTRIEQIVQSVLDCAPAGRSAVIDTACGSDTELRREVESLLAFHQDQSIGDQSFGDQSFATDSGFADGMRVLEHRTREQTEGHRIGNYRILREIGRGGMGAVYLAARAD